MAKTGYGFYFINLSAYPSRKLPMKTLTIKTSSWFKKFTAQSASLEDQDKVAVNAGDSFQVKYAFRVGSHCFVELASELPPVGKLGYFFHDHVQVEAEELRGVWLTNVDSEVLFSREKLEAALKKLKDLKFNTLYPVVWQGGYTLYPSDIASSTFGHSIHPQMKDRVKGSLGEMMTDILELGHKQGFRIIPWFEYGLMAPAPPAPPHEKHPLVKKHENWFTRDTRDELVRLKENDEGKLVPDDHVWLNPTEPKVIEFMTDLIGEFVHNYPEIDGIQLDDHFGMPKEMGYDESTKKLYKSEKGISAPPKDKRQPGWSDWVDWRVSKVTVLMHKIFEKVKGINPNCLISLSPNPQRFSKSNYMADWTTWESNGLIEELAVQLYRDTTSALQGELNSLPLLKARDRIPTGIGIFTGSYKKPWEIQLIHKQTQAVRKTNFAGVAYFFYETLFNQKTDTDPVIARDRSDLNFLA